MSCMSTIPVRKEKEGFKMVQFKGKGTSKEGHLTKERGAQIEGELNFRDIRAFDQCNVHFQGLF